MTQEVEMKLSLEYFQFLQEARKRAASGESWPSIAKEFNDKFDSDITGDTLRKRCGCCAKYGEYSEYQEGMKRKYGTESSQSRKEESKLDEEYTIRKDGSIDASKIVEYAESVFGNKQKLLEYLGYSPMEWQFESLRVSKYEGPVKGSSDKRQMVSVKYKLKPLAPNQIGLETYAQASEKLFEKYVAACPRINVEKPADTLPDKLLVLPPIEAHLGKLSHSIETGVNYDYKICQARVRKVFAETVRIQENEHASRCLVVIGGDFFNSESNGTTSAGTPQESTDTRYIKMFNIGEMLYTEGIETLRNYFKKVEVMLCAGNHSRGAEFALYKVLKAYFRDCADVEFSDNYRYTQSHMFGNTALFFNHGDPDPKRLHRSIAAEFPNEWGKSLFRYLFVGHLHKLEVVDSEAGLIVHRVPAICENDAWHYTNRFGIGIVPMHEVLVFGENNGLQSTYFINFVNDKYK